MSQVDTSNEVSPEWIHTSHYQRTKKLELIRGGKEFFKILEELIDRAKEEIHFQFYILEDDETGSRILAALIAAARRGVEIHMILDAYGSSMINESHLRLLTNTGIHFKWFKPVLKVNNLELGRRMHHKVVVVDEAIAMVTGLNIANRYNDLGDQRAWLDFALLVEGRTAKELKLRCLQLWDKPYQIQKRWKRIRLPKLPASSVSSSNSLVKVSVNDWLRGRRDILRSYRAAFGHAQKEIIILGSYFLPGRRMRKRLRMASERGAKVKVILTAASDVSFAKGASEYLYKWMFEHQIEVYEWKPNVLHGKVAMVDGYWSTIGSFNLNFLSAFESVELNLEIYDEGFANNLRRLLLDIAESECNRILPVDFDKKLGFTGKIRTWISYYIIRYSMRILIVFSKKPKPL